MDDDCSIELARARRTVELAAELLGDTTGLDRVEVEARERACDLLHYAAAELEGVEKRLIRECRNEEGRVNRPCFVTAAGTFTGQPNSRGR